VTDFSVHKEAQRKPTENLKSCKIQRIYFNRRRSIVTYQIQKSPSEAMDVHGGLLCLCPCVVAL
jgi:hypothetical protein